ncbi:hypothetical protein [Marinomonas sp.]|uniref:hypothetical protein n=1 Tax=Marinomonas sp. TaxID=1904862 RepID=UPI003F9B49A6
MYQVSIVFAIVFIVGIVFLITAFALVSWQKKQNLSKNKVVDKLIARSYRLISTLESVPDRYFPIETKILLIDYLHSIVPRIVNKRVEAPELMSALPELAELRRQLKEGIQNSKREKVASATHCTKIQNSLRFLPTLLREFSTQHVIDHRSAKRQIELVRYSHCLVHYDWLLHQAKVDLAADRKAKSLENYRTALAEIEKVAVIENVSEEVCVVKSHISTVEDMLFKHSTASSQLDTEMDQKHA